MYIYIYIHVPENIDTLRYVYHDTMTQLWNMFIELTFTIWLVVSTPLKNISQLG